MNRLKFMGAPVNEAVHMRAHTAEGATILAQDTGFSWAYLMYDWGFPPEIEKEDWLAFKKAVPVYHKSGMKIFGYIQTSNCVYDGSFKAEGLVRTGPERTPVLLLHRQVYDLLAAPGMARALAANHAWGGGSGS